MAGAVCTLVSLVMVAGTVFFNELEDGTIRVTGTVTGLAPGKHGFHIHTYGDSRNNCTMTNGHFDTAGMSHGGPTDANRHVGDLGNIVADDNGVANIDFTDHLISLSGTNSILGRAVMIHHGADPLGGKPAPGASAKVACGVIGLIKP